MATRQLQWNVKAFWCFASNKNLIIDNNSSRNHITVLAGQNRQAPRQARKGEALTFLSSDDSVTEASSANSIARAIEAYPGPVVPYIWFSFWNRCIGRSSNMDYPAKRPHHPDHYFVFVASMFGEGWFKAHFKVAFVAALKQHWQPGRQGHEHGYIKKKSMVFTLVMVTACVMFNTGCERHWDPVAGIVIIICEQLLRSASIRWNNNNY